MEGFSLAVFMLLAALSLGTYTIYREWFPLPEKPRSISGKCLINAGLAFGSLPILNSILLFVPVSSKGLILGIMLLNIILVYTFIINMLYAVLRLDE